MEVNNIYRYYPCSLLIEHRVRQERILEKEEERGAIYD